MWVKTWAKYLPTSNSLTLLLLALGRVGILTQEGMKPNVILLEDASICLSSFGGIALIYYIKGQYFKTIQIFGLTIWPTIILANALFPVSLTAFKLTSMVGSCCAELIALFLFSKRGSLGKEWLFPLSFNALLPILYLVW